jgi:diguanylate cyclase (GGDEF)-like protein
VALAKNPPLAAQQILSWRDASGPFVTVAALAVTTLVHRYVVPIPNPGPVGLCAVVFSVYAGGVTLGLISALLTLTYAAVFFSDPPDLFNYSPDDLTRLVTIAVATPIVMLIVGILRKQARHANRAAREVRRSAERAEQQVFGLRAALNEIDAGIVLLDHQLRAQFINRAFRRIFRLPDDVADRKPPFVALMYHGRDTRAYDLPPEDLDSYVADRVARVRVGDETPLDLRLADGEVFRLMTKVLPGGGRLLSYNKVTDLVEQVDNLGELAAVDGLTGLFNRRHFLEIAAAEWTRARRYARPLSALMIDIDHFKAVNDSFGHDVGDQVIVRVAAACRDGKRNSDLVARYGGEEFMLLLPETDALDACLVAERLRQQVERNSLMVGEHKVAITVSIGVAHADSSMRDLADLIKQADLALYAAKRTGRNRVMAVPCAPAASRAATPPQTTYAA